MATNGLPAASVGVKADRFVQHLRVLIANESPERLELLAREVRGLGHVVIAREITVADVATVTARERPDLALVGLGLNPEHALEQVSEIVREAFCPVIGILPAYDRAWVDEAAKRGVYAYIVAGDPEELQSAIGITLRRYAEYHGLKGAFDRRNVELAREEERVLSAQRLALALHEDVVQGLAVAKLSLELGHEEQLREAIGETLKRAQSIVSSELDELTAAGHPVEQLVGAAAATSDRV